MPAPKSLAQLSVRAQRVNELFRQLAARRGVSPWTRAELAQGFVGDVGALMKLVMAKEGRRTHAAKNLSVALEHELADCLWSVLVLARAYEVDLERAFLRTMAELEQKLRPPRRTKTERTSRGRQDSPAPKSRTARATGS